MFLVISLASFTAYAQKEGSPDYIAYHLKKYDAESAIKLGNFREAAAIYEELWTAYPHCFHGELNNLLMCYFNLGLYGRAEPVARQLVLQGYSLEELDKCLSKRFDLARVEWWSHFVADYPLLRERYALGLDSTFIKMVAEAIVIDQAARDSSEDYLAQTDYLNGKKLLGYARLNGFPDLFLNKEVYSFHFLMILRHFFYRGLEPYYKDTCHEPYCSMEYNPDDEQLIMRAIHSGHFPPESYATCFHKYSNRVGDVLACVDFNKERVYAMFGLGVTNTIAVNKFRQTIGLCPIDTALSNLLAGTWYTHLPFGEMKQALSSCDSCRKFADYSRVIRPIKERTREKFQNHSLDGFILNFSTERLNILYRGLELYFKKGK